MWISCFWFHGYAETTCQFHAKGWYRAARPRACLVWHTKVQSHVSAGPFSPCNVMPDEELVLAAVAGLPPWERRVDVAGSRAAADAQRATKGCRLQARIHERQRNGQVRGKINERDYFVRPHLIANRALESHAPKPVLLRACSRPLKTEPTITKEKTSSNQQPRNLRHMIRSTASY